MSDRLLLVYTTHASLEAARTFGKELLQRRLAACVNIFPEMQPLFFWPPRAGVIDESKEVVLLVKTLESKYTALEAAIYELHPYEVPCIMAWPVEKVGQKYYDWVAGELLNPL